MAETVVYLPGDIIDASQLPTAHKRKLGSAIRQDHNSNEFVATVAGRLDVDHKKKTANLLIPNSRYVPRTGDQIIAQVRGASQETFHLSINAYSPSAILSHYAFEGASKKTRPQLKNGDLVYARVVAANKNADVELTCVNPSTGKADGLGPLTDGMLFDVNLDLADRLLKKQFAALLDNLGEKIPGGFELVVGRNGKVWVDCTDAGVAGMLSIGRVLQHCNEGQLQDKEQKKFINKTLKELGLG